MNCAVIFFGEEITPSQARMMEVIRDLKLEPSHTLRAENEAQLSAQMREAGNLSSFVIIIGGLDPLKRHNAKSAICITYGCSLVRSPKLHSHIENLCKENGIPLNRRLEQLALIPEGFNPMLFGGITYGISGVCGENVIMVIPDNLPEESITSLKGILMTTIVNQNRILAKHRVVQSSLATEAEEADETSSTKMVAVPAKKRTYRKATKSNDPIGRGIIALGILAMILLLIFGVYLLGAGRDNPMFTVNHFSEPPRPELVESAPIEVSSNPTLEDTSSEMEQIDQTREPSSSIPISSSVAPSSQAPSSIPSSTTPPPSSVVPSSTPPASSTLPSSEASNILSPDIPANSAPESSRPEESSSPPEEPEDTTLPPPKGTSWSEQTLKVNVDGSIESYEARELVGMILQNETRGILHPEALKAQAVAAYSFVKYSNNQGLSPVVALREPVADAIWTAIDAVDGYAVYYNGKIANTVYHSTSAGYTLDAKDVWGNDVPYLRSVSSPWDKKSSYYNGSYTISESKLYDKIANTLGVTPGDDPAKWIRINDTTDGGYVMSASVCGKTVTGRYIRETLLGFALRSCSFTVTYDGSNFIFKTAGYGHGVGLSQNGSHYMAQERGSSFDEILTHYFTGAEVL